MTSGPSAPTSPQTWILVASVFIVALVIRGNIFSIEHHEGDEQFYKALVEQLEAGRGYTLQGHPILDRAWAVGEQYDQPLFYHPPGGPGFMWAGYHLFGDAGLGVAQLVSFSIFFWSMIALGRLVLGSWTPLTATVVAGLSGFTPIVSHVHTHHWLDGPQVAFTTAGCALYLLAVRRGSLGWAVPAGLMLAWACMTKMNAGLVLPGLLALAWAVEPEPSPRRILLPMAICVGIIAAAVIPWLWVQWRAFGEVFPSWAGKPSPQLVASNAFVRFVTSVRGPWCYLRLLPQALATLVPGLLALPWLWREERARRTALALVGWIALIVLVHVGLGYLGYSKLLRYVIVVTPAAILLFALAVAEAARRLRASRGRRRWWPAGAFLAVATVAFLIEVFLGIQYIRIQPRRALMAMYPDRAMAQSMVREEPLPR
jgi:4-amino-4-deoxy-L-arabinose transferase-like glycosyltransferase